MADADKNSNTAVVEDLPGMHVQLNGQVIYYEKTGQGSPVILLHGNGGDHHMYDELIAEMAQEHTFYAVDLRGHGHSATPAEYHYTDMAEDVCGLIRALQIERPILVGFSDGAIVALYVGMDHDDQIAGILSCGANLTPKGVKWTARHHMKKEYRKTKDPKIRMMMDEPDINPTMLEYIQVPTYVLAGKKDIIKEVETKRIALSIPHSKLQILKGQTHISYAVHATMLAPYIRELDEMIAEYGKSSRREGPLLQECMSKEDA